MASAGSSPFARALALEVGRLERLRLQAWQAFSLAILLASLALALPAGRPGLVPAAVGAGSLAWFTVARVALSRGRYSTAIAFVSFVVEQTVPWLIFVAVLAVDGPAEASHVWGPALAYTGMLILTTLKLSPRYSIVTGALGGAQYLALSIFVVRPHLPAGTTIETVPAGGDVVRALMLVFGGFVVAVVARGLQRALGGIVSSLREHELFGKYRLEREIASGGMGVVWLATYCPEGGFARRTAVKLVHPHLAKDAVFIEAFRREAALCARLVHQNIVQVFDFGRVEDRYFLAMEYVDGVTLKDILRRANAAGVRIPPVVAGAVTRQILTGLHFAHVEAIDEDGARLRVIHRDLAPSNILVSSVGEVKVTDFGIARALRDVTSARTETVAGHFDHMAPEQAAADALDERSDLFCAGILFYEMLTGRALFRRDSEMATLGAVAGAVVRPPSTFSSELERFDALCARALARDKDRRFQSAREMADAVHEACGQAAGDAIARFVRALPDMPALPDGESQPATRKIDRARAGVDRTDVDPRRDDVERDTTLLDARR